MDDLPVIKWPFHLSPVPMFQTDQNGLIQHANLRCLELLGQKDDLVEAQPLIKFMTILGRERYLKELIKLSIEKNDIDSQFITQTGIIISVQLILSQLRDEEGAHIGLLGVMIDLTPKIAREFGITQAAALLGSVTMNSNDAILITEAEPVEAPNGPRILYVNPAFCKMTGYSVEEIRDKTPRILQGPKTDRRELNKLRRALKAWEPVRVELVNYAKDGREFNVEIDISPVADETGFFTHWVAIQRDITVRRQQEEQRLLTLVEGVPQLIWRTSQNGDWTWTSPQWINFTGQNHDESHARGWLSTVHFEDRDRTILAWQAAESNGLLDLEFRIRRAKDGVFIWHHTRSVPVRDKDGKIIEWLGTTTDIQNLKKSQEFQQILLAELQHRSRNLLTVVRSISRTTLRRSASLNDYTVDFEGRIGALSRVQGLLARTNDEMLDLRELVEAELAAHIFPKNIRDHTKIHLEGPPVTLPATTIQTLALALHELTTNAVKYGALSQITGKLSVTWWIEQSNTNKYVSLKWLESGVIFSHDIDNKTKGYGRELIEKALPYQLQTKTEFRFNSDGIFCSILMPLLNKN